MLYFLCSPLVFSLPSSPVSIPILWRLYRVYQLQLVSPSLSCSITFSILLLGLHTHHSFSILSVLNRWSARTAISTIRQVLFILLIITRFGRLTEIRWSGYLPKSQIILCVSFFRTDFVLCIYHLFVWSNFNFLHNFRLITFPTQSCVVLYSFSANFLYLLIMWLIVSSVSPYNLLQLFCFDLSLLALTKLVLKALLCAAVRRHSVSLSRFPFLSHVQDFSFEVSLVCNLNVITVVFLPIFVSGYFCSIDACVICIVSGGRYQSSSALFDVVSSRCIDASTLSWMLVSHLSLSFLDTCSQSTTSQGCKALRIAMSFLGLWPIYLSYSLVHFTNGSDYLTRWEVQVFIFWMRFLQCSFISSSFLGI